MAGIDPFAGMWLRHNVIVPRPGIETAGRARWRPYPRHNVIVPRPGIETSGRTRPDGPRSWVTM